MFSKARIFFRNFHFKEGCKDEIADNKVKYAVDSLIQFSIKSILRPMSFTETIRQRGS